MRVSSPGQTATGVRVLSYRDVSNTPAGYIVWGIGLSVGALIITGNFVEAVLPVCGIIFALQFMSGFCRD